MINRRGIGVGQVFLFIVAAITFSLIMIFGYKAISGFINSGEDLAFVQFKEDLESSIQRIYTEFGSVRIREYTLPTKFKQICFVDLDAPANEELRSINPEAFTVWNAAESYEAENINVFLSPPARVPIKVFRISMENDFICPEIVNGHFSLLLEGKGDHTELSIPDNKE